MRYLRGREIDWSDMDDPKSTVNLELRLLPAGASIRQAIERLDQQIKSPIVFTVNELKQVTGCITDGDIRRALLRGENLEALADKIARKSFTSAKRNTSNSAILAQMRRGGVRQIPILDEEGRLLDLKFLDDFTESRPMAVFPVVIMAGGRGSRLGPVTDKTPKPLLKIGDQSIIERIIIDFHAKGVSEFYVTVNYLADQIMSALGDGEKYGCKIHYIHESAPLGTAGSLFYLKNTIESDFLVINGDVLSTVDLVLLANFHREHKASATVCAKALTINIPYGVVKMNRNDLVAIDEKPDFSFAINSGIYFFSKSVLDIVEDDRFLNMTTLLENLVKAGRPVKCFRSIEPWIDIGSQGDFERAQKYLEYLTK